jgi:methylmalonyl-CoA/ethylmalonyl-CoA epimerase
MVITTAHRALARFGKISQIAFLPQDWDATFDYWTRVMGAGPFYDLAHIPLVNTRYRGTPQPCDISAALGYWGDLQIELLRQHDNAPSIYREWIDGGRSGVHHIGIVVDDFDAAFAALLAEGGVAVQETEIPDVSRAAYFEMPGEPTPLIEILGLRPEFVRLWEKMRRTAAEWDGVTDALRPLPPADQW